MKKLRDAGFAIHIIYRTRSLDRTKSTIIDRYLKGEADMMTNLVNLPLNAAPDNIILDLKTMKILGTSIEHDDAIKLCNSL